MQRYAYCSTTGDIGVMKIVAESASPPIVRTSGVTARGALDLINAESARLARGGTGARRARRSGGTGAATCGTRAPAGKRTRTVAGPACERGRRRSPRRRAKSPVRVLAARVDAADPKLLRDTVDRLKDKLGNAVIVLGAAKDDKVSLIVSVTGRRGQCVRVRSSASLPRRSAAGRRARTWPGRYRPAALDAALDGVYGRVGALLGNR